MEALVPIGWQGLLSQASDWLRANALVPGILAQAACALLAMGAVRLAARPLQRSLLVWAARLPSGPLYPLAAALARAAGRLVAVGIGTCRTSPRRSIVQSVKGFNPGRRP